jgi:hypothetical protein
MAATLKFSDSARQKLPPPDPGPIEPVLDPPPYQRPRVEMAPAPQERVWRVQEPELPTLMPWLASRLMETWPRLSVEGLVAVMRDAIHRGDGLLIRSDRVCGLFHVKRTVLEPLFPTVEEQWVRSNGDAKEEASLLYRFAAAYAREIKASELVFNVDSDVPMDAVLADLDRTKKLLGGAKVWRLALK